MSTALNFAEVGRLPAAGDNVAIATRALSAGCEIKYDNQIFTLSHSMLEGHRFALKAIAEKEALLSWGLPFGHATRAIQPGDYICNPKILNTLKHRSIDFELPDEPNFIDYMQPYVLDEATCKTGEQVARHTQSRTFMGYKRPGSRGVGTRNHIVVLGTSSLTGSYARTLADSFKDKIADYENIDGVVAVAHTEGGSSREPNNRDFLLRTLAGFIVHANTAAVLVVDYGNEAINNQVLAEFIQAHSYPLADVTHKFMSLDRDFNSALQYGHSVIDGWIQEINKHGRTEESAAHLKLALQCGGSDAFSGISGNALAGWVAKETIKNGGSANLAETDELIGAEPYVLANVRNVETARTFLEKIETFKERAAWHGHSAEGNPSGGNQYRGLYNIAIKSIGAARKKDPEVRLDYVIDYAQPMQESGYYFMDSPGNDLESIAGQVASGANLILFITGNGSITNFPFVPTLKFVTTTGRWQMLANEMDVNAGRYQDGMAMDDLGMETFDLALKIASGQRSLGEQAGHAQVSIWRDWRQTEGGHVETILNSLPPAGKPLTVKAEDVNDMTFRAYHTKRGYVTDRIGLVVPTSLCSGQVAKMIAEKLNNQAKDKHKVSRYVALVHTEGCGAAPGYSQQLYLRTMLGHVKNPIVTKGLMLEHGCEQTHNDAMREYLRAEGVDVDGIGWASVQMDGGIKNVMDKAAEWFDEHLAADSDPPEREVGLQHLKLGLTATGELSDSVAAGLAQLARRLVNAGGLVVIPENAALWQSNTFRQALLVAPDEVFATLAYGQSAAEAGLHVMETPTDHAVETLTGLGATGVEIMLSHQSGPLLQAHPMIPLLQVSADQATQQRFADDLDVVLANDDPAEIVAGKLLGSILRVASREYVPQLMARGNTDFQLTRGLLGLSL